MSDFRITGLEVGCSNLVFATDGEKAGRIPSNENIDLIISDWNMHRKTPHFLIFHLSKMFMKKTEKIVQ